MAEEEEFHDGVGGGWSALRLRARTRVTNGRGSRPVLLTDVLLKQKAPRHAFHSSSQPGNKEKPLLVYFDIVRAHLS